MAASYDSFQFLQVERRGAVAVVTLNRPESYNAIDGTAHAELERVWPMLAEDTAVRAIVLTGAGKAFSSGGNLKLMASSWGTEEGWKQTVATPTTAKRLVQNMLDVPQPLIAAVNGDAMGLGVTLALCCDITVASEKARLGDTHVKVGLVAGDGGAVLWPLLMGPSRAKDFLMRGRVINGVEAERIGLVNYVAAPEAVMTQAMALAEELAALPPLAVQWSKVAVNKQLKQQLNTVFDAGIAYEMLTLASRDHKEAVLAMLEKRGAQYNGY